MRLLFSFLCVLLAAGQAARCRDMAYNEMLACLSKAVGRVCGEDVYVSPEWVGHPVCVSRLVWLKYVYNMRAYSCGLDTSSSLVPSGRVVKYRRGEMYTYTREPEKDRAHQPEDIASAVALAGDGEYSVAFHRALVHMFGLQRVGGPIYDRLAVETGRPCSFTQFLRERCRTQKEAHYVLAALVLLSEGVDVPIETAGNKVIVKKRKDSNDVLVNACVPAVDSGERQPSETWQVVNFFKRYRGTYILPGTYGEFKTGDFLESPQLLILTYIGEYVENAEELISVMECIFNLLEGMGLAESVGDAGSVVGRMFVRASRLPEAQAHLAPFLETFPALVSMEHLDEFECFQRKARYETKFVRASYEEKESFGNYDMNCGFLGACLLLPCLAYDPEKNAYSLEGLLAGAENTEEVAKTRAFFEAVQESIEEGFSLGRLKKGHAQKRRDLWLMVHRQFMEALGSLEPTVLNQMRVLAQMTGRPQAVVDELAAHQAAMDAKRSTELKPKAIECVRALLHSIAVNKGVKVWVREDFGFFREEQYRITITHVPEYTDRCEMTVVFTQEKTWMTDLKLPYRTLSTREENMLVEAVVQYRKEARVSGFVLAECMHRMAASKNTFNLADTTVEDVHEAARWAVECSPARPTGVLMVLPAMSNCFREVLVSALVLYAEQKKIVLTLAHPVGRLIANVIGGIDLSDPIDRRYILKVPVVASTLQVLCPALQMPEKSRWELWNSYMVDIHFVPYPVENADLLTRENLMWCLRAYAEKQNEPLFRCKLLHKHANIAKHSKYLFAVDPVASLEEVCALVLADNAGEDLVTAKALANALQLSWLALLLGRGLQRQKGAIVEIYKTVKPGHLEKELEQLCDFWLGVNLEYILGSLDRARDVLVREGGYAKFEALYELYRQVCIRSRG
ncbi:uncharacterized protein NEMAJ01_2044 [Nematocida major]|uniref:uncharacterized protein n=1 Tax=Nematocida major TaxID=1912982 RepID=UPI0020076864|nr:uncharacterized protein NEMAJ01_2044 [Nematocida major]KAH9387148.1 hypothetical protein NEMAJ01_2044 [Nematocida major]